MVEVTFSDIGEGMTEGEILHYFAQIGDEVHADQPLIEVQTDKMVAEIPAPADGTIKSIQFDTGTTVTVGEVLMEIDTGKGEDDSLQSSREESDSSPMDINEQVRTAPGAPVRIKAAPHTRRIARELEIDIEKIEGTGPSGRVTDEDVYRFRDEKDNTAADSVITPNGQPEQKESMPFRGVRKQIAQKMRDSWNTIPHVTHFDEADITNLLNLRNEWKRSGDNISVASVFIKAVVLALKDYKIFNAQLNEENETIDLFNSCHIGLATDTEEGIMVPAIPDADKKSIRTINQDMKALTEKAQGGNLVPSDGKDSTFTVNNVGPLGGTAATPIINKPHTGIMSFHKAKKKPAVIENDEIAIRSIMKISFSFDHRVADGGHAIGFVNRFIELVENPDRMLVELI